MASYSSLFGCCCLCPQLSLFSFTLSVSLFFYRFILIVKIEGTRATTKLYVSIFFVRFFSVYLGTMLIFLHSSNRKTTTATAIHSHPTDSNLSWTETKARKWREKKINDRKFFWKNSQRVAKLREKHGRDRRERTRYHEKNCHEFITNSCFSHNLCIFISVFDLLLRWMLFSYKLLLFFLLF